MKTMTENFRLFLKSQLQLRTQEDPSYSLRKFSKDLEMNPGQLSLLLNGKKIFTERMIRRLCKQLHISDFEVEEKFLSVEENEEKV